MRVLSIVHQADTGPGVFLDAIGEAGAEHHVWQPPEDPHPPGTPAEYDAIISCGGSVHPVQDAEHPWLPVEKRFLADAVRRRVPLLGVCLGNQLIAEALGTRTRRSSQPEIGWFAVQLTPEGLADAVVGPLADHPGTREGRFEALQWHSYEVPLPDQAVALARSEVCLQCYRIGDRVWGVQFHPEVTREDFQRWLDVYDSDEDAVRIGVDPASLAAQTAPRIAGWNELGRGLCARFLRVASEL